MKIQFYNNRSGINVLNKRLEKVGDEIEFTLKKDTNILTPNLLLSKYNGGNYCYIPEFKRYYYINNYNINSDGVYDLTLSVDVLGTYKDDLLNGKLVIKSDYSGVKYIDNNEKYSGLETNDQFLILRSNLATEGGK